MCKVGQKERRRCLLHVSVFLAKAFGQGNSRQDAVEGGECWKVRRGEGKWVHLPEWAGSLFMPPSAKPKTLTLPFLPSRMTQNHTSLEFFVLRLELKSLPLGLPSIKALT